LKVTFELPLKTFEEHSRNIREHSRTQKHFTLGISSKLRYNNKWTSDSDLSEKVHITQCNYYVFSFSLNGTMDFPKKFQNVPEAAQ